MKAERPDPKETRLRYENDPNFNQFVSSLVQVMDKLGYGFTDLNQAIWAAATITAERKMNKYGGV